MDPDELSKQHLPQDSSEIERLKKYLKTHFADRFAEDIRYQREYRYHTLDYYDPTGMTAIDSFNFKGEDAAKEALAYIDTKRQ